MALLKIILIAAAVYYIIKLLMRLILPFALKKLFEKMQNTTPPGQTYNNKKEGRGNHPICQKRKLNR
jgi:hypothetical protein